jgi:predicted transport protein
MEKQKMNVKQIIIYAGAFIAFLVGSGFATGQEIMQYFVAYGFMGILGALIVFTLFLYVGVSFILAGNKNKFPKRNDIYIYYCGKIVGIFYDYFSVIFIYMSFIVMIGGAGATLQQQYGLPTYVGGIGLAIVAGGTVVFGLNKIVDVIGSKELGDNWKDIQANYLHTIGNLTLTGYNSELIDRPFNEKRDMKGGFADSPLHLNKSLANLDTWNEEEIKKRAEELSKVAVEVWPIPEYKDIEDYKITAKEMLINVFPAEKNLIAAKEIIQEIARIVDLDQAQHILSVTYRDGNMISVNLGNWLIIRFKRVGDSYEISLCLDWSYSERFESYYFSKIEDFSDRWSSGRWVRLVTFPWNHTIELAEHIKDSWESAILTAYQVFKSWTASSYKKYSQEELAAHLFQEDYKNKHINSMSEETLSLFNLLRRRILNLDASVHEEYKKVYIAYKTDTNFVDIIPLKKELILTLNMPFDKIYDPHNLCKDISSAGHWGNGDVEFRVSTPTQLDMAMYLINQSFESHRDDDA